MSGEKSFQVASRYIFLFVLLFCLISCGGGGEAGNITSDKTAPTNTTSAGFIDVNASDAVSRDVILSISATDNQGVTAYLASENYLNHPEDSPNWVTVPATTSYTGAVHFTLSEGFGIKTVYIWFKDAEGNISGSASDSIHLAIAEAPPESPEPEAFFTMGIPPVGWTSGQVWINAVHDTGKIGESSVEIDWVRLYCVVGGAETLIAGEYTGNKTGIIPDGGGLYLRYPWFGSDYHEPLSYLVTGETVTFPLSSRADRVWHPVGKRSIIPSGATQCYATARVKPEGNALVQVGLDFWINQTADYCGPDVCNREGSGSNWYGKSIDWIIISSEPLP